MKKKSTRTKKSSKKKTKPIGFAAKFISKSLDTISGVYIDNKIVNDKATGLRMQVSRWRLDDGTIRHIVNVLPPPMKLSKRFKKLMREILN